MRKPDKKREEELLLLKNSFTQDMFGGEPKNMNNSPYPPPPVDFPHGVHPRVLLTRDRIPVIKELLREEQYAHLNERFWREADATEIEGHPITDGYFERELNGERFRYDNRVTSALECKSLAYLLTGDKSYAYEAITGAKNIILTLKYSTQIHSTPYQGARHVILTVSKVYDWCYDAMNDDDRRQLIGGLCNLMIPQHYEWEFPPSNMSAVSGHGTGPFFLTLYVMMSIAFADEMPDWWTFVIGRYYAEYVPVIIEQTKGGWVSQGTACYGPGKFYDGLIPGWMLFVALGVFPYNLEDMSKVCYYIVSHDMPSGMQFPNGDGLKRPVGCDPSYLWGTYMVSALLNDKTLALYVKEKSNNFSQIAPDFSNDFTVARLLAMIAYMPRTYPGERATEGLSCIQSFGYPAGQMTARRDWTKDSAAVMLKTGNMTMSNHDNYDHGTFQIYYKGLLAGPSGEYASYGNLHHLYYHQATIAYNGLLIFNPDLYDKEAQIIKDLSRDRGNNSVVNRRRHYYSGSQKYRYEPGTMTNWLGGDYNTAEVVGTAEGLTDEKKGKYAYMHADITKAYHRESAELVERRMLAVFADGEFPLRFFTYDTLVAADGRQDMRKTFVLHTNEEPTVDKSAMSAVSTYGGGKLTVHSLYGASGIEKIGGEGYAYWLSGEKYKDENGELVGKNCTDNAVKTDRSNVIWGRIDLVCEGKERDELLTAMYASDRDCEKTAEVKKAATDEVFIACVDNTAAVFVKSETPRYEAFEFTLPDLKTYECYISGLNEGTWRITWENGDTVIKVDKNHALAVAIGVCGKICATPFEDVIGKDGGRIAYELDSPLAVLPEGAPTVYRTGEETPLPLPTHPYKTFLGWYTKRTLSPESRISELSKGHTGEIRLYSKWSFTHCNLSIGEYAIGNCGTADFAYKPFMSRDKYKTDENGVRYLEWQRTDSLMYLSVFNRGKNVSDQLEDTVSYEFLLRRDGKAPLVSFESPRLSTGDDYNYYHNLGEIELFRYALTPSGDAQILSTYGRTLIATVSADKVTAIRLTVDLLHEAISYYGENGELITKEALVLPKEANGEEITLTSFKEWKSYILKSALKWSAKSTPQSEGERIRLYGLTVKEGSF